MKAKKNQSSSSSSKIKHMSSSQASRALLESSTETFNTNSTISISSDSNRSANYHEFINKNDHDHIQQEYDQEEIIRSTSKKKRCYKLYLKPLVGVFMLVLIVSVVIVILCFFDNFALQSNNKPSNSPSTPSNTNITTITTSTTTGTTTTSQVSQILTTLKNKSHAFRWNHCGQTYYNPSLNPHHIEKRIIGGEDAVEHSWPFLVSVRIKLNKSEHQCGGSLITDQHILTAGHCIFPYFHLVSKLKMKISEIFSLIEVHVGINEHEKDPNHLTKEQVYMVEYFDFHENFNFTDPWILVHDIAIIKLKRKVNLNRPEVNVVCLPSATTSQHLKEPRVGENVVAIGWGSYAEEFNYTAYVLNTLQQAMFTVIDQNGEKCNSGMIGNRWDRNFTVCATGYEKKQVTCFGDSGGPVMAYRNNRWTLIGIISFAHDVKDYQANKKKCNASMPFYFVNVAAYIDWVNKKTGFILGKFQS